MIKERDEVEQRAPGGDEVECHSLGVEFRCGDFDRDPPAVAVRRFHAAAIGQQMVRRLESGMNFDAIAAHRRIVVGRRGRRNRALAGTRAGAARALVDSNGILMTAIDKFLAAAISRQIESGYFEPGQLVRAAATGA